MRVICCRSATSPVNALHSACLVWNSSAVAPFRKRSLSGLAEWSCMPNLVPHQEWCPKTRPEMKSQKRSEGP